MRKNSPFLSEMIRQKLTNRKSILLSLFEKSLPDHYQTEVVRTSQVQMAFDISEFLNDNSGKRILVIEAPVGTGKSLGALIPSMLEKRLQDKRVLYATATINLQGQLMRDETPLLDKLGFVDQPILAKGKTHYFCMKEFRRNRHRFQQYEDRLDFFNATSQTGHRDEFESRFGPVDEATWKYWSLTRSKGECDRCELRYNCATYKHRSSFLSAENDLIITNHDQLIRSVLNVTSEIPHSPIVPLNPGIIVIDEAHDFQTNFLGQVTAKVTIEDLRSKIPFVPKRIRGTYVASLKKLQDRLTADAEKAETTGGRYPISDQISGLLTTVYRCIDDALTSLVARNQNLLAQDELAEMLESLRVIWDAEYVTWIEYEEDAFCAVSTHFPEQFRQTLDHLTRRNKVIVMSGTLTPDGDFTNFLTQWRINPKDASCKTLPTPFDFSKQAMIYVPNDLVAAQESTGPDYLPNQISHIQSLLDITDGRTLILCTSKVHMNDIHEGLMDYAKEKDFTLLMQTKGAVEQLTRMFKEDERSVLVGSGSFFSGFSVPGQALISVILTRLPFPVPNDPYLELLSEGLDNRFQQVTFPHMMVKLKQAVGRLIRDISDYGVISILDSRVFTSDEYGTEVRGVFEAMGYRFTRSVDDVRTFIASRFNRSSGVEYATYDRSELSIAPLLSDDLVPNGNDVLDIGVTNVRTRTASVKPTISEKQWAFAEEICQLKGQKLNKKRYKTPFELYRYLFSLFYTVREDTSPVSQGFPFDNDEQRDECLKYNGHDLIVTYVLPPEELEKYRSMTNKSTYFRR
ncbi:ATP-dependent DNA helicase [Alicyclobacillus fodiniaquatilis]|uniref:ATP-dependent DNA helicase n=1 Tax=Alicyclobacillus fodiniaquatilis TaxID=1661150 RepID=A0ABW4JHS5_9BACL